MRRSDLGWMSMAMAGACTTVGHEDSDVPGDGIAEVSWRVGSEGCEGSGVTAVEVRAPSGVSSAPCSDGSALVDLPAGTWDLELAGVDDAGVARYSGVASGVWIQGGEVTVVPTVLLGANPASLTVTWWFDNARLCGANGVVDLDIALLDDDYIVASVQTTCDDGIEILDGLVAGTYALLVLGRDETGVARFQGDAIVELEKGAAVDAEVRLVAL